MKISLLILAGGMGSRYKGQKQVDAITKEKESLMEFALFDAARLGVEKFVFVINDQFPESYKDHLVNVLNKKDCSAYFVEQTLFKYIPEEFTDKIKERQKPLGTAHAVYCAKDIIKEPFITVNADDFYGPQSFEKAIQVIKEGGISENNFAMLAFRLKNTLSNNGSVSRGICEVNNGYLKDVEEFTSIEKKNNKIVGFNENYKEEILDEETQVSMNFWVLDPAFFERIENDLYRFLKENTDLSSKEFYLPGVIDNGLKEGKVQVEIVPTSSSWFGLTYRGDREMVARKIMEMKDSKTYPERLWE